MLYFDATVFLYPSLYSGPKAERGARLLRDVAAGKESGVTASLTFDEVVWKIAKHHGRAKALEAADAFLAFPNLRILPIAVDQLRRATELMKKYAKLDPRDAIHAAAALISGVRRIASDDADYDRLKELERVPL